jgi:arsenite oxidase small subunit
MGRPLKTVGTSRRRFLKSCAVAASTASVVAASAARADCEVPRGEVQSFGELLIATTDTLAPDESMSFDYPAGHPCVLVRVREPALGGVGPGNSLVAFSAVCPHRGQRLDNSFLPEHGVLGPCPWHESTFDVCKGGAQVVGQANRDLPRVLLEQRGADIYATGLVGVPYRFHPPEGA